LSSSLEASLLVVDVGSMSSEGDGCDVLENEAGVLI